MPTVAHIVERIVQRRPFLQEALSRGIVNNAALAEELMPEISKELRIKVKFSAVNMAIRRLADKLDQTFVAKATFGPHSDIIIRSDLMEITVYKTDETQKLVQRLYDVVDFRSGDFLTITQGLNEVMVITNKKHERKMSEILPKKIIKKSIKNLASLTVNIPIEAIETMGLFYIVTRALSWEDINIVDIVSSLTEMTVIIKEDDATRAFDAMKRLITENS